MTLSQHTDAVSCVKWSGEGLIYTASRDKSIKVWDARDVRFFHFVQRDDLLTLACRANSVDLCQDMRIGLILWP